MYELKIILLYGIKFLAKIRKTQLPNISQQVLNYAGKWKYTKVVDHLTN